MRMWFKRRKKSKPQQHIETESSHATEYSMLYICLIPGLFSRIGIFGAGPQPIEELIATFREEGCTGLGNDVHFDSMEVED
jgi:hypothetical protein